MKIFDEVERNDQSWMRRDESLFEYHNRAADPYIFSIRNTIEKWFQSYPTEGKKDLQKRLRSVRDDQFQGAFFELLLHQMLFNLGCNTRVHPKIECVNASPDFLVNEGDYSCYIEAKSVDSKSSSFALNPDEQDVINKLNSLDSPYFHIGVDMEGKLSKTLSNAEVRRPFIKLLENYGPDEVQRIIDDGSMYDAPSETISHGGWTLKGWLHPISSHGRDNRQASRMVLYPYKARFLDIKTSVVNALKEKASKYGKPAFPLVLAISSMDPFFQAREAELEVLFGKGVYLPEMQEYGRMKNGFWHDQWSSRVSAVWIFHRADVLNLCSLPDKVSACLYINPSLEEVRLPKALHRLTHVTATISGGMGRINWVEGDNVGSVLGL